jgi:hypothetical protein
VYHAIGQQKVSRTAILRLIDEMFRPIHMTFRLALSVVGSTFTERILQIVATDGSPYWYSWMDGFKVTLSWPSRFLKSQIQTIVLENLNKSSISVIRHGRIAGHIIRGLFSLLSNCADCSGKVDGFRHSLGALIGIGWD